MNKEHELTMDRIREHLDMSASAEQLQDVSQKLTDYCPNFRVSALEEKITTQYLLKEEAKKMENAQQAIIDKMVKAVGDKVSNCDLQDCREDLQFKINNVANESSKSHNCERDKRECLNTRNQHTK